MVGAAPPRNRRQVSERRDGGLPDVNGGNRGGEDMVDADVLPPPHSASDALSGTGRHRRVSVTTIGPGAGVGERCAPRPKYIVVYVNMVGTSIGDARWRRLQSFHGNSFLVFPAYGPAAVPSHDDKFRGKERGERGNVQAAIAYTHYSVLRTCLKAFPNTPVIIAEDDVLLSVGIDALESALASAPPDVASLLGGQHFHAVSRAGADPGQAQQCIAAYARGDRPQAFHTIQYDRVSWYGQGAILWQPAALAAACTALERAPKVAPMDAVLPGMCRAAYEPANCDATPATPRRVPTVIVAAVSVPALYEHNDGGSSHHTPKRPPGRVWNYQKQSKEMMQSQ